MQFSGLVREAVSSGERRLVTVSGRRSIDVAIDLILEYVGAREGEVSVLLAAEQSIPIYAKLMARDPPQRLKVTAVDYKEVEKVLGGTWDLLLMDVSEQFRPNDVGRLVEVVAGGGLVIFALPPVREWLSTLTLFQRRLVVPPYGEGDVRQRFKRRFLRKVRGFEGCWLADLEEGRLYGEPRVRERDEWRIWNRGDGIYRLAATDDQLRAVRTIHEMGLERGRRTSIVIASRGRGKSAAVGLGLAALVSEKRKLRIAVTAPELMGIETLVEFFKRGLEFLGIKYVERDHLVKAGKSRLFYIRPEAMPHTRADIKVVDEAAAIPVPLLNSIVHSSSYSIFSTTIHGYEGAGRGFSLRFLKNLREIKDLKVAEIRMETPIRYPPNDPVEAWLYDFLLLDAEPAKLSEEDLRARPEDAVYVRVDLDEWFERREDLLRELYGIYVIAHYRNRPDDLGTLADAPHHFARALMLRNGKIVVSLQLAEEGGFGDEDIERMANREWEPSGHILPHRTIIHHGERRFPKLRGVRIVRIATHPSMMDRGFGSKALEHLVEEARAQGYDWVGSGFGATEQLMRFWIRNEFVPIHMSPAKNPVSGEYTVLVVRPLNRRSRKVVQNLNYEFKVRLLNSLHDVYYEMDPRLATTLLDTGYGRPKVSFSKSQLARLRGYVEGWLSYEATSDAIAQLFKLYFLDRSEGKPELSKPIKSLIVGKVFQGKRAPMLRGMLGIKEPYDRIREVTAKVYAYYKALGKL